MLRRRIELLERLEQTMADAGLNLQTRLTCETAEILFKSQIESRWKSFVKDV